MYHDRYLPRRAPSLWRSPGAWILLGLVAIALVLMLGGLVHAQTATPPTSVVAPTSDTSSVIVPIGAWISAILTWARDGFLALLAFGVARWAPDALRQYLTNQLLAKAVDYAMGVVQGAVRGKELSVSTINPVLKQAESYAVANAPKLAAWLGATLKPKLMARLSAIGALPAEATSANTGVIVPPVPTR
jgi:hypothetical protein